MESLTLNMEKVEEYVAKCSELEEGSGLYYPLSQQILDFYEKNPNGAIRTKVEVKEDESVTAQAFILRVKEDLDADAAAVAYGFSRGDSIFDAMQTAQDRAVSMALKNAGFTMNIRPAEAVVALKLLNALKEKAERDINGTLDELLDQLNPDKEEVDTVKESKEEENTDALPTDEIPMPEPEDTTPDEEEVSLPSPQTDSSDGSKLEEDEDEEFTSKLDEADLQKFMQAALKAPAVNTTMNVETKPEDEATPQDKASTEVKIDVEDDNNERTIVISSYADYRENFIKDCNNRLKEAKELRESEPEKAVEILNGVSKDVAILAKTLDPEKPEVTHHRAIPEETDLRNAIKSEVKKLKNYGARDFESFKPDVKDVQIKFVIDRPEEVENELENSEKDDFNKIADEIMAQAENIEPREFDGDFQKLYEEAPAKIKELLRYRVTEAPYASPPQLEETFLDLFERANAGEKTARNALNDYRKNRRMHTEPDTCEKMTVIDEYLGKAYTNTVV